MNAIRVSATAARNRFFDLLNQVAEGKQVIIERDKKEVAVISTRKTKTNWLRLIKASRAAHGILKAYSVEEISPTRRKDAWRGPQEWGIVDEKKKRK